MESESLKPFLLIHKDTFEELTKDAINNNIVINKNELLEKLNNLVNLVFEEDNIQDITNDQLLNYIKQYLGIYTSMTFKDLVKKMEELEKDKKINIIDLIKQELYGQRSYIKERFEDISETINNFLNNNTIQFISRQVKSDNSDLLKLINLLSNLPLMSSDESKFYKFNYLDPYGDRMKIYNYDIKYKIDAMVLRNGKIIEKSNDCYLNYACYLFIIDYKKLNDYIR